MSSHPLSIRTLALGLLSLNALAHAQTDTPLPVSKNHPPIEVVNTRLEFRQFEKVEITGSSIVRKEQTQALPVQVITREDIRRSGLKSITEVVQALPLMGNFVEAGQIGMVAGGYSSAAIHGMPTGTLVLVDGLRMAPFGRADIVGNERASVDLGTLPLADIERIEVLTDGASSLYGTDAIAGVVNIILRKERKGFEITADHLRPSGGAGQGWVSSIGWGRGQLARDGYSLMVTAEISKRQELLGKDRPYASAAQYEFETGGQRYAATGPYNTPFTSPATLLEWASLTNSTNRFVNQLYQSGSCTEKSLSFRGQTACLRNAYPSLGIYPSEENQRLHASGEMALSHGHTVFTDLLVGRTTAIQSNNWWPVALSASGLPAGSAAYSQAQQAGLDPSNTVLLWRPDLPALRSASLQTNGRVTAGVRGEWQEWHYRSSAYFAQSRALSQSDTFGDLNYNSLGIIDGGVWRNNNVMLPLNNTNPLVGQLEALRGGLKTDSMGTTRLYGLQAKASRTVAEIDGKDVMLGLGMDQRTETSHFQNHMPENLQIGPSHFDAKRQVQVVYGELQVPVTHTWDINLGARSDRYSDVGTVINAKIFSRWEITPAWSMRGSWGTGFRAPTVAEIQMLDNAFVWGQSNIPLSCNAQQQTIVNSLSASTGIAGTCNSNAFPYVLGNGNPDLKPEKSIQFTWGAAFMPNRNLRLSADLWSVHIHNTHQYLSDELVLGNPERYAANYRLTPAGFSSNGITPGTLALYLPQQNLGVTDKRGIDFEAQWRHPGDWGRWNLSAQATYLLRSSAKSTVDAEFTSDLGQYDSLTGTVSPRLRMRMIGGFSRENWSTQLIMNHTSSYQNSTVSATDLSDGTSSKVSHRVTSFTTWDVQASHAIGRQMDVRLGVRNVFNRQAPLSFTQTSTQVFGANTIYSNLWGRSLELGMTMRF
jgi:iron complex outermembrane receptor protein